MKKKPEEIFKTLPKEDFKSFFNKNVGPTLEKEKLEEAIAIAKEHGYLVLNEVSLPKWIVGVALSLGLITNAMAGEFNARTSSNYTSKSANTSMFSKDMQKGYNMKSDVQLTDEMVQKIVDSVAQKIAKRMTDEDKYEEEELLALPEWQDAVEFYKKLVAADESLGNMFSRRLDKALTQSIRIAPNIQRYVIKNG